MLVVAAECHYGCAPAASFRRSIGEAKDVGRPAQDAANKFPLDSDAAPVNNAQRAKTEAMRFLQPSFDCSGNIAWREGVQIQHVRDRDLKRLFGIHTCGEPSLREYQGMGKRGVQPCC